jgi:hypothetical protein
MKTRRPAGPLAFSIGVHIVLAVVILNAAFHWDFSVAPSTVVVSPEREQITYVAAAPRGGVTGGTDSTAKPKRATTPSRGLVAPLRVPTSIAPVSPPTGGQPGGVDGGKGVGSDVTSLTGITPGLPDPRLTTDPHAFFPEPKTHAERVDSAIKATILAYNDSIEKLMRARGKEPGDWTFEKNGQKWGIDGNKIYLGKYAIPSAVLAALPIRLGQANPGEGFTDRLAPTRRADLMLHADAAYHDEEFNSAVKRIRERKDREREEQKKSEGTRPVAAGTDVP